MKNQKGNAVIGVIFLIAIVIAGFAGWVLNIVKLADMDFAHITGMIVLRAIGILMAPLGAVLGYC